MDNDLWLQAQAIARKSFSEIYEEDWYGLDKYQREDCIWYEYEKLLKEKENTMNTKLICPNCGTSMKLPEKSEVVMGMTLSKETGGTHVLQADVIKLLASEHNNIMAVGDDAQSIYSFRGANYRNILDFPKLFNGTKIIKLPITILSI